jgi:hypothetical protein
MAIGAYHHHISFFVPTSITSIYYSVDVTWPRPTTKKTLKQGPKELLSRLFLVVWVITFSPGSLSLSGLPIMIMLVMMVLTHFTVILLPGTFILPLFSCQTATSFNTTYWSFVWHNMVLSKGERSRPLHGAYSPLLFILKEGADQVEIRIPQVQIRLGTIHCQDDGGIRGNPCRGIHLPADNTIGIGDKRTGIGSRLD